MAANGGVFLLFLFLVLVTGDHECERICRLDEAPKKCYYQFTISIGFNKCENAENEECHRRTMLTINGKSPGPFISVCENDFIIVDVKNSLPLGLETSFHWHGLRQQGTPHMDGVPMITQCPIYSGTTFRYNMKADRAGTFYYHAHSVFQQLDGLNGALIIRRDATISQVILLSPQLRDVTSIQFGMVNDLFVDDLKATSYVLGDGGQPERIRIINAAALDCSLIIVSNEMTLVALDGNEIQPAQATHIILHPGERGDILSKSKYRIMGMGLCAGKTITDSFVDGELSSQSFDQLDKYLSQDGINLNKESYRILLPFDVSEFPFSEKSIDFRYKLGEETLVTPAYISGYAETVSVYQFSNFSFFYPSSPLLLQSNDIDRRMICSYGNFGKRCNSEFCECINILRLPFNRSIDLILIDEGKRGKTCQTIHLHGHTFRVIGKGSFSKSTVANEVRNLMDSGKIEFDLVSPVEKDTVAVPNPGYAILRIKTDNPGDWLLESIPSKAKSGIGLELILHVPAPGNMPSAPKNFPRCGSLKPQDLVIIDE